MVMKKNLICALVLVALGACAPESYIRLSEVGVGTSLQFLTVENGAAVVTDVSAEDLPDGEYSYVALLPPDNAVTDSLGIVGVPLQAEDVPSGGNASYSGQHIIAVVQETGGSVYQLQGSGAITASADFEGGNLDILYSDILGVRTINGITEGSEDELVALDLEMALMGASISGSSFSGGNLTLGGVDFHVVQPSAEDVVAQGYFFGPQAMEVGGVITVDDPGVLLVYSAFVAAKE
jgi:hypothetical protein